MTEKEKIAQDNTSAMFRAVYGTDSKTAVKIPTVLLFANKTDAQDFILYCKSVHYTSLADSKLPRNKARTYVTVNNMIPLLGSKGIAKYGPEWSEVRRLADTWRVESEERESKLDSLILDAEKACANFAGIRATMARFWEMLSNEEKENVETGENDARNALTELQKEANSREMKRAEKAKRTPVLPYPLAGIETGAPGMEEMEEMEETEETEETEDETKKITG